jgi:hypothetical protein
MSGPLLVTKLDLDSINKALIDINKSNSSSSSSSDTPIEPLSSAISANTTYYLPATYPAKYTIYIPSDYLIAASGGPYTLTIKTPKFGSSIYVPIIKNGDTLLSGSLQFDVYVDASGNVSSESWNIAASNGLGVYEKYADRRMHASGVTAALITSSAIGNIYYIGAGVIFPSAFTTVRYPVINVAWQSGYIWPGQLISLSVTGFGLYLTGATSTSTGVGGYDVWGTW